MLVKEIKATQEGAGLFVPEGYGFLSITGLDSPDFLHRLTTNEVNALAPGMGNNQALLDRKGHVLALFHLWRQSDTEFLAVCPHNLTTKTQGLLEKLVFAEDVTIKNISDEFCILQLVGPHAKNLIDKEDSLYTWSDNGYSIPFWNCLSHTKNLSASTTPLTQPTLDLLRMEAGIPEYGVDMDETHTILEAPLDSYYVRSKGCYPGQEVVERILAYGQGRTPQLFQTFYLAGPQDIAPKSTITTSEGRPAGSITSSRYHPILDKTLVMVYLERKFLDAELQHSLQRLERLEP